MAPAVPHGAAATTGPVDRYRYRHHRYTGTDTVEAKLESYRGVERWAIGRIGGNRALWLSHMLRGVRCVS